MSWVSAFYEYNRPCLTSASVTKSENLFLKGEDAAAQRTLEESSKEGDLAASTHLARRLLVGKQVEFNPDRALDLLRVCVALGSPDAAAQFATLHANGSWVKRDWGLACQFLLQAAELGSFIARGQVVALCDETLIPNQISPDAPSTVWKSLFHTIDWASLCAASSRESVLEQPRIRVAKGCATARVCDWLIAKGLGKFNPSMMFDGNKSAFDRARTCSDFKFDIVDGDCVLGSLRERISAMTTLPILCFEPPQVFHYAPGQEIKAHFDSLRAGERPYGATSDYTGDRIVTFLLYLNGDYEGGELVFPKVNFRHRGAKGDGVFFASVDQNNLVDRLSLHAALPVIRGEKYILSQWIHDRPFTA